MSNYAIQFPVYGMGFDAHLTLRYLGPLTFLQQNFFQQVINDLKFYPISMDFDGFAMFGANNNIPVVKYQGSNPQHIASLYRLRNLIDAEWPVNAEYPLNPHITLPSYYGELRKDSPRIMIPRHIELKELQLVP